MAAVAVAPFAKHSKY